MEGILQITQLERRNAGIEEYLNWVTMAEFYVVRADASQGQDGEIILGHRETWP